MIRAGIGGWTFEPWRESFYPPGLPRARELEYAASRLTAIEVNGTFYRTQTPATFRKWAGEVPDDFVFALKAPRGATHRNDLSQSGPSVQRFLDSGITELGPKLGPILWQFPATHRFDAAGFPAFADMLPARLDGLALRHVVEVEHASYRDPAFVALLRERCLALAHIDDEGALEAADCTADFVYARLKRGREEEAFGYAPPEMDAWLGRARQWAAGEEPADLPRIGPEAARRKRDVFVFFIHGGKVRAPAAAQEFLRRLAASQG
jgi:uncharacterized protein YecE (DUF72 family)